MVGEYESKFDKKIWKIGGSVVITIPADTMEKLKLEQGEILEVAIRRSRK